MKIALNTNLTGFENDLCDVVRLFFGEIELSDDAEYSIFVEYSESEAMYARAEISQNSERLAFFEQTITAEYSSDILKKRYMKRVAKVALFRALKKAFSYSFTPWGSLTGIRPTHLLRELEEESDPIQAKDTFLNLFDVQPEKYALAKQIIDVQKPIITNIKPGDIDVYINIPYCKTKCLYCSFPSAVRTNKTDMHAYIDALKADIAHGAKLTGSRGMTVRAIYMGGGTPTVLTESELDELLTHILGCYGEIGVEFTVEAGRPDTITQKKLQILKQYGVTRLSINPQSMNAGTLIAIGRSHTPQEIISAYEQARELGFTINMDIIACLPHEGEADFTHTLNEISKLDIDNLTVHTLAVKRASSLKESLEDWAMSMPDSETANNMLNTAHRIAESMDMRPYYMYRQKYMRGNLENIGYARAGAECIYNIDMMEEMTSILAHGAGAMTKRIYKGSTLRVERLPNPKDIATYMNKQSELFAKKDKLFE